MFKGEVIKGIENTAMKIEAIENRIYFLQDSLEKLCGQASSVKMSGEKR